ncbi:uncharacterized protein LOC144565400 isoform X1 [Carex rostrata]
MEKTKRPQIPSFGDWNYYTEVPVKQSGLVQETGYDLFYVSSPAKLNYHHKQSKGKKGGLERDYTKKANAKQRKEVRRAGDVAVNPVDEDLYKIPPELLNEKPRRRSSVKSWLTGCIGLSRCLA